jgi:ketosteroid isomerase-like protein
LSLSACRWYLLLQMEWIARGKSAKGSNYENYYHLMFEVRNGKIQAIREYVDTLYAKEVLFSYERRGPMDTD